MKLKLPIIALSSLFSCYLFAQNVNGLVDTTFNQFDRGFGYGDGPNDQINKHCVQPDGKTLLLGNFVNYNDYQSTRVMRITPEGDIDSTFNTGTTFSWGNIPSDIVLQNDGKIIIVGDFDYFNGNTSSNIIRLNTDGSIDQTFDVGSGTNGKINSVVIQPDGKIIIVGEFSSYDGYFKNNMARIHPDGQIDNSFNIGSGPSGGILFLSEIVLQLDGKMIVSGGFTIFNGVSKNRLVRLNSDGSLDNSFNVGLGTSSSASTITIQPDGKILIGGNFDSFNSYTASKICRLNSDGSYDPTFNIGTGFDSYINDIQLDFSGNILVAGNFLQFNGINVGRFVRLTHLGSVDNTFGGGFDNVTNSITVLSDNKILVSGVHLEFSGNTSNFITKFSPDGTIDTLFNKKSGINGRVYGSIQQTNGKVIVYGSFKSYNNSLVNNIVRINVNGNVDLSFLAKSDNIIQTIVEDQTGKILVGGNFNNFNDQPKNGLVRLTSEGVLDATFNPNFGTDINVKKVIQQPDGKYLVAGAFYSYNGLPYYGLIRLNNDGTTDVGFNQSVANWYINDIKLSSNGKILVCGAFGVFNGTNVSRVVRLMPSGIIDNSFNVSNGPNDEVTSLNETINGEIIVTGNFNLWNTLSRKGLVILNSDGSLNTSLNNGPGLGPEANTNFKNSYVQSNGKILLAGSFKSYNGYETEGIIRLYPNGEVDSSLSKYYLKTYSWGNYQTVENINVLSDGSLIIGGSFTKLNDIGRNRISKLNHCVTSIGYDTLSVCDSLVWINGITYYSSQNSIQSTIITSNGCDSLVYLNLTVNYSSDTLIYLQECDSFTWPINNQTYTISGQYIDTIPNVAGCDSIVTLNLTILNSSFATETVSSCDAFTWSINNQTYTTSGQYIDTIPNAAGCDSIITLDLTIIPSLPLTISNSFSLPSDANSCVGELAMNVSGNADFELNLDNGSQIVNTSGYSLINNLCPGVHDLLVTDNCGDTLSTQFVIPIDSNYVFNNPFIDSIAVDSLGTTITNCDIYYNQIDTAYIDSIWATGNTVNVIWNIVDANGSNFDTSSYVLNNGNGVYWLQLSVFCPTKALGDYFTVTEAIYFNDGTISMADLAENTFQFDLFPNPTNNEVTLTFDSNEAQVTIYDTQGKLIQTKSIHSGEQVSLKEVETGVYFFEVITEKGSAVKRVVKN